MTYLAKVFSGTEGRNGSARRPALIIEPSLVMRVRERDETAFTELVGIVYEPLVRFAHGLVGGREGAEDIVQDVLAALWTRAEQWSPNDPVTYLFVMVRHRAIDLLRRRLREEDLYARVEADATERERTSPSVEEEFVEAEASAQLSTHVRALEALIATLSERQRAAYDLRYRQGMTIPEIARILGITTKSGEQLLGRLVRTIRERLQDTDGFGG